MRLDAFLEHPDPEALPEPPAEAGIALMIYITTFARHASDNRQTLFSVKETHLGCHTLVDGKQAISTPG